ncbi:MAG: hypothetical protein PHU25_09875 [Deltaproteobacteria bacterium]|nr:hypothetical protein [Deltaproteobacteria bacterium]
MIGQTCINDNSEPLEPALQLRVAIDEDLTRAPCYDGDVFDLMVHSLVRCCGKGPEGAVPEVRTVPVKLVGRWAGNNTAENTLGWTYEGRLYVSDLDIDMAGGINRLPDRLKEQLGSRCARVIVHSRDDNAAKVTATFSFTIPEGNTPVLAIS